MRHALLLALPVWLASLVACDAARPDASTPRPSEGPPTPEPVGAERAAAPAPDPACVAKVAALEPFLVELLVETASHEINFGWTPQVVDRSPSPLWQEVDNVTITPTLVSAYDASETNHTGENIGVGTTPQVAHARLAAIAAMKVEADRGPDDLLRVDVDAAASWGEVARVLESAAKAGYTKAVFAFEATSKLVPPEGVASRTTSADDVSAATSRVEALMAQCEPWKRAAWNHESRPDALENARAVAKETAAALLECRCAVDPDEVGQQLWKRERWHQAHTRAGVTVGLGGDLRIELPKTTPWSEAHARLLAAEGKAVTLVAQ